MSETTDKSCLSCHWCEYSTMVNEFFCKRAQPNWPDICQFHKPPEKPGDEE